MYARRLMYLNFLMFNAFEFMPCTTIYTNTTLALCTCVFQPFKSAFSLLVINNEISVFQKTVPQDVKTQVSLATFEFTSLITLQSSKHLHIGNYIKLLFVF